MAKDQDDVEDSDEIEDAPEDDSTDAPEDDDKGAKGKKDTEEDADEAKLPAWAQKELTRARREAAKSRTSAKGAEKAALEKLAKALGLNGAGDVDPEKLQKDLESERSTARRAKIELTVVRRAGKVGADPDAVLDSAKFLSSVADLDPADEDFGAQVDAAIREAIKENPRLGTQVGRQGRGGGDFGGSGSGDSGSKKDGPKTVEDAYALVRKRR